MRNANPNDGHDDSHEGDSYRRIELITGNPRRRQWTPAEKAQIVAESFRPGVKASDVARRHGVSRGVLWSWRREAREQSATAANSFVPLRILEETPASAAPPEPSSRAASQPVCGGTIEVEIGGARVRIRGAVDAAALRQVLAHFRRAP
jgi:transposase